ncbi:N-6 DNA methylase [soil metagenome]
MPSMCTERRRRRWDKRIRRGIRGVESQDIRKRSPIGCWEADVLAEEREERDAPDGDAPRLWSTLELPEPRPRRDVADVAAVSVDQRRKELGAFFTPPELVGALTTWAVRSPADQVLEPSAGEAAFLLASLERLRGLGAQDVAERVTGVEIDARAFATTNRLLSEAGERCRLMQADFFEVTPGMLGLFTAVIGNPPYVRYHLFRGEARKRGLRAAHAGGVELSGLASSWAPFVVHAARFLGPTGRLAFVLPAELLQVDYAAPIRAHLLERFGAVTIVTFERAVFPGAMIDTVLLLAERGERRGLRVVQLRDASDLSRAIDEPFSQPTSARWSDLRIATNGLRILDRLRADGQLQRLGDVASVDIGCVTGGNDFFILTAKEAKRRGLSRRYLRPVVARPAQLAGAVLSLVDAERMLADERCLLLALTKDGLEQERSPVGHYLRHGRRLGVSRGYKCRVRKPWYAVPGIRIPDAFMSYMASAAPRVVANDAGFASTNLVHQLTFHLTDRHARAAHVVSLHSSLSLLSFEIEGRSYGGGVLKLETREAERVELPRLTTELERALSGALPAVDAALRLEGVDGAAEHVDRILLRLGVHSEADAVAMRETRAELKNRRSGRGRTS